MRRESRDVVGFGLGSWWRGIWVRMERDMQIGVSIAVIRLFLETGHVCTR